MEPINILIGIQARSTSKRFPGKVLELIGEERVLDHVVEKAKSTAVHLTRFGKVPMKVRVALLIPYNDKILYNNFRYSDCMIIEGPENDVLSRYVEAQNITGAHYIVRLTSDCPLMLDFMISKHINVCVLEDYDYVSNVHESCRTIADGFDCEVMTAKALAWLDQNAVSDSDREHVTTLLRTESPKELRQAVVMSKLDTSSLKMSVDTPEDIERIRVYFHTLEQKKEAAQREFGPNVFWV